MIDDDKREVMRLQEMYLPDGDLFSEGHGRTRRFRWKNLGPFKILGMSLFLNKTYLLLSL